MKTTNESGNEQNVVSFELLITIIETFGSAYNPPTQALSIPGLKELAAKGRLQIDVMNTAEVAEKNTKAAQALVLDDFGQLVTRVINAIRISGVSAQTLAQAEALVRDLRGKRASEILSDEEIEAEKAKGNIVKQVVVHNAAFNKKIENFAKLIVFLESTPEYKPNEPKLTIVGLKAKLADIKAKNADYLVAATALDAARISRDVLLYTDGTGLVDTGLAAKLYTKSAFGATSPQYKQISVIKFTKR